MHCLFFFSACVAPPVRILSHRRCTAWTAPADRGATAVTQWPRSWRRACRAVKALIGQVPCFRVFRVFCVFRGFRGARGNAASRSSPRRYCDVLVAVSFWQLPTAAHVAEANCSVARRAFALRRRPTPVVRRNGSDRAAKPAGKRSKGASAQQSRMADHPFLVPSLCCEIRLLFVLK